MRLENRLAVVTGAAGGIGRAVCARLAAEGARIAALDLTAPPIGDLRLPCDLADSEQVAAASHTILAEGVPDIVVHAGAIVSQGGTLETPADNFAAVYNVNVGGAVRLVQALAPAMKLNGRGGAIILISSINARFATPSLSAYAASKAGLDGFGRTLALELADHGIRVNIVAPASVDTPMLRASFDRSRDPATARANNILRHPLGRLGSPEDIAAAVMFLASDDAAWITGAILPVDGGAGITRR